MNPTKIEWTDYTINPVKGVCQGGCWYCYARRMYQRFKWNPNIRFDFSVFKKLDSIKKPSRIFVCSMHDLFGEWIPHIYIYNTIKMVKRYPRHIFQFLTKNPKRYFDFDFPQHCWLGVTIENDDLIGRTIEMALKKVPNLLFISFEPLMSPIKIIPYLLLFRWIIIGAMTGARSQNYQPKAEWIESILRRADKYKIPVFMKDNLQKVWKGELRREFPR